MPRVRIGGRLKWKDREEIRDWYKYLSKCKNKEIKPMIKSEWIIKRRKEE